MLTKTMAAVTAAIPASAWHWVVHYWSIMDWPRTLALLFGLALGAGYVWAFFIGRIPTPPARHIFLKGTLFAATVPYIFILGMALRHPGKQTQPLRTIANVPTDRESGNEPNGSYGFVPNSETPPPSAYTQSEMDADAQTVCAAYANQANAVNYYNQVLAYCQSITESIPDCDLSSLNGLQNQAQFAKQHFASLDEQFYQKYDFAFSSRYNCD